MDDREMKNTEEGDAEMEKKKLLIYAHYYIPDTASTGQILRELAEGMLDKFDITVICVVPSYLGTIEDKYKTQKYYEENINGVKVLRIRVPEFSKTNKKSRIKNIVSYFFGAMAATLKVGKMDYVFSISQPPILGGLLGVWGKWVKRAKYIYNIQDFNPEQVLAVGYSKSKLITDAMTAESGADFTIVNGGGIRASLQAGPVTLGDINNVLPFTNTLTVCEISPADIYAALEHGYSMLPEQNGAFSQTDLKVVYSAKAPAGERIKRVYLGDQLLDPSDTETMYKVATNDFMAAGGDGYTMFGRVITEGPMLNEVFISYLEGLYPIN